MYIVPYGDITSEVRGSCVSDLPRVSTQKCGGHDILITSQSP